MVILVDTFIATHRVQHKNVETDFLSILYIPGPSEWDGLIEIQKMPSAAGRERAFSRCFATNQNQVTF